MSNRTPIEVWPAVRHGGRAGFSAKHFAMIAGAAADPLRTAERLLADLTQKRIVAECEKRVIAGEDPVAVFPTVSRLVQEANAANWERLCGSFEEVVKVLESAPQNAVVKRLAREARRAGGL